MSLNGSDKLPAAVRNYLLAQLLRQAPMLALLGDADQWQASFGDPAHFGLGDDGRALAELLLGQDAQYTGLLLSDLQIGEGCPCELHQIVDGGRRHVLLIDRSERHAQAQGVQQRANEALLQHEALQRRWLRLHAAHQALNASFEEVDANRRLQEGLVRRIAHEFGTPISVVLGHLQLLREPGQDERQRQQSLQSVRRGVEHLHQLVESVLDQVRLRSHQFELHPVSCDLAELVEDFRQLFAATARERGLDWQVDLRPVQPPTVEIDSLRLRQVLYNLLSNAFKFTVRGGVACHIEWVEGRLRVRVVDSGPGMSSEQQAQLFQEFRRFDTAVPGTGLGLVISQQILAHMQAELGVRSSPGAGTEFHFDAAAPALAASGQAPMAVERSPMALVIDDDPDIRDLLAHWLQAEGWRARTASSWAEALSCAGSPDLALIDLSLAGESGLDALAMARVRWPAAELLAMSADRSAHLQVASRAVGAAAFLGKPVAQVELRRILHRLHAD